MNTKKIFCTILTIVSIFSCFCVSAGAVNVGTEDAKEYVLDTVIERATSTSPAKNATDVYYIHMGLPDLTSQKIQYNAPKSFYVPANRTVTFNIEVPDDNFLPSARACKLTSVIFSSDSSANNTYVESCKIVTPNGITVTPNNGRFSKFEEPSSLNYLEDSNHVPLAGTWKVTIRTSKSLYFNFALTGYCDIILGNSGNEAKG